MSGWKYISLWITLLQFYRCAPSHTHRNFIKMFFSATEVRVLQAFGEQVIHPNVSSTEEPCFPTRTLCSWYLADFGNTPNHMYFRGCRQVTKLNHSSLAKHPQPTSNKFELIDSLPLPQSHFLQTIQTCFNWIQINSPTFCLHKHNWQEQTETFLSLRSNAVIRLWTLKLTED